MNIYANFIGRRVRAVLKISALVALCVVVLSGHAHALSQVFSVKKVYEFVRASGRFVDEGYPVFLARVKSMSFSELRAINAIVSRPQRSHTIFSLAIEKRLMSEVDALYALGELKKFEERSEQLVLKGVKSGFEKLDDYHELLLNKVAAGEDLSGKLVAKQVAQLKNGGLAGTAHPKTGVLFDDLGFPIFKSHYEVTLPRGMYMGTDYEQFQYATTQLAKQIAVDPKLAKTFSAGDVERISMGYKPRGYTWHHSQREGVLQLVDTEIHQQTSHTGGRAIWGGGAGQR